MPAKEDRQVKHITESEEKVGRTPKEARQIAYATVEARKKVKRAKKRA